jgi:hypothetical protein
LVNITTSDKQIDPDKDCVIDPGEGVTNFVVRRSTVAYGYARNFRKNQINAIIREGKCQYAGRFSEEQVSKIQERGASSESINKKYKCILKQILQERELDKYIRERSDRRFG